MQKASLKKGISSIWIMGTVAVLMIAFVGILVYFSHQTDKAVASGKAAPTTQPKPTETPTATKTATDDQLQKDSANVDTKLDSLTKEMNDADKSFTDTPVDTGL
jgi:flagellar basal body-associated protein FliL